MVLLSAVNSQSLHILVINEKYSQRHWKDVTVFVFPSSCAGKNASGAKSSWSFFWVILIGLAIAAGGAYMVYKYRLRVSYFQLGNLLLFVF